MALRDHQETSDPKDTLANQLVKDHPDLQDHQDWLALR